LTKSDLVIEKSGILDLFMGSSGDTSELSIQICIKITPTRVSTNWHM